MGGADFVSAKLNDSHCALVDPAAGQYRRKENDMAHTGFSSGIDLIDVSSVLSANLEFNRVRIAAEARDLANECECEIEAWTRDNDGEPTSNAGITAWPSK